MTDAPLPGPIPYQVSYSERVGNALRLLGRRAKERGRAAEFLAAVKEIDKRLHLYPQFGEPLRDLTLEPAQVWVGAVPPLVVQYILDEQRRLGSRSYPAASRIWPRLNRPDRNFTPSNALMRVFFLSHVFPWVRCRWWAFR